MSRGSDYYEDEILPMQGRSRSYESDRSRNRRGPWTGLLAALCVVCVELAMACR